MESEGFTIDRYRITCKDHKNKAKHQTNFFNKLIENSELLLDSFKRELELLENNSAYKKIKEVTHIGHVPSLLLKASKLFDIRRVDGGHQAKGVDYLLPPIDPTVAQDQCSICLCQLLEDLDDDGDRMAEIEREAHPTGDRAEKESRCFEPEEAIVKMSDCLDHYFHLNCLHSLLKSGSDGHLKCPVCQKIYGVKKGDQPPGKMTISFESDMHCDSFPDVGIIIIDYHFPNGVRNGVNYSGTRRTAYLPATEEGKTICLLLKVVAWSLGSIRPAPDIHGRHVAHHWPKQCRDLE